MARELARRRSGGVVSLDRRRQRRLPDRVGLAITERREPGELGVGENVHVDRAHLREDEVDEEDGPHVLRADVEHDQEDRRNQDEQEAGDESEIVGFHGRWRDPREGITDKRPTSQRAQPSSSAVAAESFSRVGSPAGSSSLSSS